MIRRALAAAAALTIAWAATAPAATATGTHKPTAAPSDKQGASAAEISPVPDENDADRERIVRMQGALREIINDGALRRTRVGMRVMEARTGRLLFEKRGTVLMDPASNQKVLATTTALMRLGADWRFRTELSGPAPDADGVIAGDVYLRGSGDPTVTSADLAVMASALVQRGAKRIDGAIIADPRRLGSDQAAAEDERADGDDAKDDTGEAPQRVSPRAPLVVNHGLMSIRVRPGASANWPAEVSTSPSGESFVIKNSARTKPGGKTRVSVRLSLSGARIQVEIAGKIALGHRPLVYRRRVPQQALYSAVLLRAGLQSLGVPVRDPARVGAAPAAPRAGKLPATLLARHESAPLSVLLRRINKDSDNDHAERVLEAAGAEVYGGGATTDKGLRLLREVIGELGLPPGSYVPKNGSGLGHANRITADAMADLLRALYLDPRVGPELLQSLSVGGVDGTTRNRFKGTLASHRVRAKTGTLAGKSCLSGLVGDGPDVLAFSILVQGLRGRHSLGAVRGAQVNCVNAMMRYVRDAQGGVHAGELAPVTPAIDIEAGQEVSETEGEAIEPEGSSAEDPVDAVIKKDLKERAAAEAAAPPLPSPLPASGESGSDPSSPSPREAGRGSGRGDAAPLKAPASCCSAQPK